MKFSIVTPSYNMEHWIATTIESVLSQEGDFEIEYTIVDDGSTDRTIEIANKYQEHIKNGTFSVRCRKVEMRLIRKSGSRGMYSSINRGFAQSSGDIYAWINADDAYEPGAFNVVRKTFETYPHISWLKGITSTIDENGERLRAGEAKLYHQDWLTRGIYGQEAYFVEQDSVFWKRELWENSGPLNDAMKSAADYQLWMQFARRARLWTLNRPISMFRKREGQLSKNISVYKTEQRQARPRRDFAAWRARLFFTPQSRLVNMFPVLRHFFVWVYPYIFPNHCGTEYINIENDVPVIRTARSYLLP